MADPDLTPPRDEAPLALKVSIVLLAVLVVLVGAILVVLSLPGPEPAGLASTSTATPSSTEPAQSQAGPDGTTVTSSTPAASELAPNATPKPTRRPRTTREPTPSAKPAPSLPVDATIDEALARCPTAAEVAFVDRKLRINFFDDLTGPELDCRADEGSADLTRLQKHAYQAVLAMRWIVFDEPLPWTDRPLFAWFVNAVDGIDFWSKPEASYCCNGTHIMIRSAEEMAFLHGDGWSSPGPEGGTVKSLVMLLVHEARHAEGFLHDCNATDPDGGPEDDRTIEQLGAWGVHYWLQVWYAQHVDSAYMTPMEGPPDLYTTMSQEGAENILRYRICEPPDQ